MNFISFYILILGGAIAGAICGKSTRSIFLSFIGLLVFLFWAVLIMTHYDSSVPFYYSKICIDLSITAGIMTIVGSIIGKYLDKRKALETAKTTS